MLDYLQNVGISPHMADDPKNDSRVELALTLAAISVALNIVTLFVILLRWNMSGTPPKWDAVAVSLTVLEIFLAIIALGGFWLFRGIVKDHAAEVAKQVSIEIAEAEAKETAQVVAFRAAEAAIALKLGTDEDATQAQVDAFGDDAENGG